MNDDNTPTASGVPAQPASSVVDDALSLLSECQALERRWAHLHEMVRQVTPEWQRLLESIRAREVGRGNGQPPSWADGAVMFLELSKQAAQMAEMASEGLRTCDQYAATFRRVMDQVPLVSAASERLPLRLSVESEPSTSPAANQDPSDDAPSAGRSAEENGQRRGQGSEARRPPSYDEVFDAFYSGACQEITAFLETSPLLPSRNGIKSLFTAKPDVDQFLTRVRARMKIGPVDVSWATESDLADIAAMLSAWFTAEHTRSIDAASTGRILTHLGFSVLSVAESRAEQRRWINPTWFAVETAPLHDENGASAAPQGAGIPVRSSVLCVWDKPNAADLANLIATRSGTGRVIVLHFGCMTVAERVELGHLCQEHRHPSMVIDDALILYLCGPLPSRLRALFACTLPFATVDPEAAIESA